MNSLLYVSKASNYFEEDSLRELVALSAQLNAEVSLTGFIFYQEKHFIQYIEGQEATVEAIYKRINSDDRHGILIVVRNGELSDRRFPNWQMNQLSKHMPVTVRLEKILADYLLIQNDMKDAYVSIAGWEEKAWEMVDNIALFYAKQQTLN